MRKPQTLVLTAALLLLGQTWGQAQESTTTAPAITVAEAVIATSVVDRQAADNVTSVAADVGKVYCWTRLTGAEGEVQVQHVWYHGDNEMARVSLRISGSNWRTWSSKNITPDRAGAWRVDIVGPAGNVLDSVSFTVRSAQ